uniref:Uncharacterized protein n=1 Tax=Arundo donax TaxID=35708 RepID=A0A0A9BP40_ARUDO
MQTRFICLGQKIFVYLSWRISDLIVLHLDFLYHGCPPLILSNFTLRFVGLSTMRTIEANPFFRYFSW